MVISSSNTRSPSPMSMRSNLNHNPNFNLNSRIDQETDLLGVRKSFSFAKSSISGQSRSLISNTPANIPAEFARRCSFGREGGNSLQDHEKENERDPNSKPITRVRSPSVPKMTKNFMSPTISAVSKINPSPRKKVLGEKIEATRTSVSLSKGKFRSHTMSSLDFSDENGTKEDMVAPPCSTVSNMNKLDDLLDKEPVKKVTEFSPGVKIELEHDFVRLCPDEKSSATIPRKCDMPNVVSENNVVSSACSSLTTAIAPLDADLSLPPYDPGTNFLSPRPLCLIFLILLGFTAVYQGKFAKENINGLLSHMGLKAIEDKFSPLPFDNLTAWQEKKDEDRLVRNFMTSLEDSESRPSVSEELELKSPSDYEKYDELIEEFERQKLEENNVVEDSVIEDEEFAVKMTEEATLFEEVGNQGSEYGVISEVQDEFQHDLEVEFQLDNKDDDDKSLSSLTESPEVQPQVMIEHDPVTEVSESLAVEVTDEGNPPIHDANEGSLVSSMAAASLFVVSLLTVTAFMLVKRSKTVTGSKIESKVQKNQSSEAQSMERRSKRNYKRESLASSSEYTMSSSYGSFTTYSILHSKQLDDEVVTPVRRSSRFRSKVISP